MSAGGEIFAVCVRHDGSAAGFQCCECGQLLCQRCVEVGSHLIFCGLCGERAIELDELEQHRPNLTNTAPPRDTWPELPPPEEARPDTARHDTSRHDTAQPEESSQQPLAEAVATPASLWQRSAPPAPTTSTEVAVFIVNHAVVPAATIAMVSALLFFLIDVRSVFLPGTAALKWIGFWFVNATVLTARYGRTSANAERQGCYTLALAGATVGAMTVSSAANPSGGFGDLLANLAIILVVWRFATRLTRRLSFEGNRSKEPESRLYGTERLRLEQLTEADERGTSPERGQHEKLDELSRKIKRLRADASSNPVVPVARLVAAGLLAFALGEPFLLSGPPAAGERALGAMIVFLLAAGVVLAAGSGLGNLRRIRSFGGHASLSQLPGRIAVAFVVMLLLLALGLAMPGIEYQGSGALRPAAPATGVEGEDSDQFEVDGEDSPEPMTDETGTEQPPQAEQRRNDSSGEHKRRDPETSDESPRGRSTATPSLIGQLAELGKWLRYAVIIVIALLVLWGLWWLLNHLSQARLWLGAKIGGFFRRAWAGFRGLFRRREKERRKRSIDPFADLEALRQQPPREAVVAAYGRLLAAFELLDHPRPERRTPYEFLASIPARLKQFARPARDLTEIYIKVAYSETPADEADRREALAALEAVKMLVAQQTK